MLMKEFLMRAIRKMKSLNIKNSGMYYPAVKLVNLTDLIYFNPEKLGINIVQGNHELSIYYVTYDNDPFYLVVDDARGFIENNSGAKYLTFSLRKGMNCVYDNLWKEIGKLCGVVNDFGKDYNVIMFESCDDVSGNINISTMTIILKVFQDGANYFPQVCLSYCKYE